MNKAFYPLNWPEISYAIKDACGWCCQVCNLQCRRPGEPYDGWQRTLTVAHWDSDYESDAIFVVACCAACHLRHDAPLVWHARRRQERLRRQRAGQLHLTLQFSLY